MPRWILLVSSMVVAGLGSNVMLAANKIVHDAEYYILEAQNEKWVTKDKELVSKLAEFRKKYGQPPNLVYILWDDTASGAVGFPRLQKNFGYNTHESNKMAAKDQLHPNVQ